jgi:4-amino-4-deoxy-L-arabinose transferase-like glycosyltransferase
MQPGVHLKNEIETRLGSAHYVLFAFAILLALFIRTVPLTYSHFWDETVYLQHAKIMLDGRSNYDELSYRPPFLPVLYAVGFAIWDNIYVANFVQGLITTLVVVFAVVLIRPMFGLAAALFGGFLFAFTPYFVVTSHELLTDMPAVTLMLAAMWLFDKPGARYALLSGVMYALAIQTRFTSLFLLAYFVLDTAFSPKKIRNLALLVSGSAGAMIPYLIWSRWSFGSVFFPFAQSRKIITQWTAPNQASLYASALGQIFTYSTWLFFLAGILLPLAQYGMHRRTGAEPPPTSRVGLNDRGKRRAVLLIWGAAFFLYMLSIPHKEVRYLLPMAIPVVIIGALGVADIFHWFARQGTPTKVAGLLLGMSVLMLDYAPSLKKVMEPWVDRTEWEEVQIGRYLREVSASSDTIYAAHNFPVFAFYSARRTVSLLPFQDNFDQVWRDVMKQPGFLVYYIPAGIKETHSMIPSFKPDRKFIETRPNFRMVRTFPGAIVYRYEPELHARGGQDGVAVGSTCRIQVNSSL